MMQANPINPNDRFNLTRLLAAQEGVYVGVLSELKVGEKRTDWMWFIFPQIDGLGFSSMSKRYAIKSIEEAQEYLNHPVLGKRLKKCTATVFEVDGRTVSEIFGYPDDMKLKSSMTLFSSVPDSDPIFASVLDKYFNSESDLRTIQLLDKVK